MPIITSSKEITSNASLPRPKNTLHGFLLWVNGATKMKDV